MFDILKSPYFCSWEKIMGDSKRKKQATMFQSMITDLEIPSARLDTTMTERNYNQSDKSTSESGVGESVDLSLSMIIKKDEAGNPNQDETLNTTKSQK